VQPYFLHVLVTQAGGRIDVSHTDGLVAVSVDLPAGK
jgi:hypothetical protein